MTISKWGVTSICSSSDINEIPNKDTIEKYQALLDSGEEITLKDFTDTQEFEPEYESTSQHVFLCWGMLILFAAVYSIIGVLFLKQVDKDKR